MLTSAPIVSVIVPVFNVEKYLKRCLDSILAQSLDNWELICVNDATPDASSTILAEYASRDSRIRIINHSENKGLSEARNTGLRNARGRWILFVDSDDCIHPRLLEYTINLGEQHDASLVTFDYEKVPCDYELPESHNILDASIYSVVDAPLCYRMRRGRWIIHGAAWSMLYRKELLNNLYFKPILFEDYPYTMRVMLRCPRTVILKASLYYYSCNPDSIMQKRLLPVQLEDYYLGLLDVWNACENASNIEKKHVLRNIFPDIIKQMYNRIRRSPKSDHAALWEKFASVLRRLKTHGCLKLRGNKITRWLSYIYIMNKY